MQRWNLSRGFGILRYHRTTKTFDDKWGHLRSSVRGSFCWEVWCAGRSVEKTRHVGAVHPNVAVDTPSERRWNISLSLQLKKSPDFASSRLPVRIWYLIVTLVQSLLYGTSIAQKWSKFFSVSFSSEFYWSHDGFFASFARDTSTSRRIVMLLAVHGRVFESYYSRRTVSICKSSDVDRFCKKTIVS